MEGRAQPNPVHSSVTDEARRVTVLAHSPISLPLLEAVRDAFRGDKSLNPFLSSFTF